MRDPGEPVPFMRVLWRLVHGLEVRSKRMARELGVTGPQRLVMRMVGRHPGVAAGELASLLDLHPSTLTGVLKRLETRGYLRRVADAADRRRVQLFLTTRGRAIDRERGGTVEAAVRRALGRADARVVRSTDAVLKQLVAALTDGT
jgi:DNA-binding MarR family transcriptional regulator